MSNRSEIEIIKNWKSDMTQPLVSICCITYNHEIYIEKAIESFLMQETSFPFEIIIRDDCSTDKTTSIVKKYEEKYPNLIKPIYEKENQYSKGVRPMPIVINKAVGKYLALCEGDDYWGDSLKIQKQLDFLEKNKDFSISFHDATLIDSRGKVISLTFEYRHDYSQDELICGIATMPTSATFMRKITTDIPESFKKSYIGDTLLCHHAGLLGKAKFQKDIKNSAYRVHSSGVWSGISYIKRVNASIGTRRLLIGNLQGDQRRIDIINDSIIQTYLEYLFLFLRSLEFKHYLELLRVILNDKEVNTSKVIGLHLVNVPKRILMKLIKSFKGRG